MNLPIQLTILVENTARERRCLGEHGLSIWLQTPSGRVLFDSGQGRALMHNARALAIDLSTADAIVLSHGHYDHTGGLPDALATAAHARLFAHPHVTLPRYSCSKDRATAIGMPEPALTQWQQAKERWIVVDRPTQVIPGVWCTGPIPRRHDDEDVGGPFFLDPQATEPDPIDDDQAIYFDTDHGVVVVCGCAHAGVMNTVDYVRALTQRPVSAILGGMHLLNANSHRLQHTYEALTQLDLDLLAPCHCTGVRPTAELWHRFASITQEAAAGATFQFGTP